MSPETLRAWTSQEVAERWVKLYPAHTAELCAQKNSSQCRKPQNRCRISLTLEQFVVADEIFEWANCAQGECRG
jgi:hypothetical protein